MGYREEPFVNPYVGSIAQLMQAPGQAQAQAAQNIGAIQGQAAQQRGQAWGQAIAGAGQTIGGAIQQAADPRAQMERLQLDQAKKAQGYQAATNQILATLTKANPDGSRTLDRTQLQQQMAQANIPLPMQSDVFKSLDDVDKSITSFNAAKIDHMADLANGVLKAGGTEEALTMAAALAKANGLATDAQLQPIFASVAGGADIKPLMIQIRSQSEKYKDADKGVVLPPTPRGGSPATLVSPEGATMATGAAAQPAAPTEAELALQAAGGDPAKAMGILKPGPQPSAGAAEQRYLDLQTKQGQGQKLSTDEAAFVRAYERNKTLGTQTSSAAADARQASAQTFTQQEAGRKELTEKVEQPYQQALAAAQTLRDTVEAAKGGNKIAANLQGLETTMSAIRAQGLNRINSTELGLPANAGSLWDRVAGGIGRLTAGQPVPADLQKDMTAFASVLEKAAAKKYSDGFDAITKRYGLSDEKKLTTAPSAGQPIQVGGFSVVVKP